MLVMAFYASRAILGVLAATIPGGRRHKIAGVLIATFVAGALQGGLVVGEMMVRSDGGYERLMQPEPERRVAREMRQWELEQQERGVDIGEEFRRAQELALREKHRELPFMWILGCLLLGAVVVGATRTRPGAFDEIPRRLAVIAIVGAVGSIALTIAIDALFV
jgi:hypothetical protein